MTDYRVIPRNRLPARLHLVDAALVWMFLDYVAAPVWLVAVVMTLAALGVIGGVFLMCKQEPVDPIPKVQRQ